MAINLGTGVNLNQGVSASTSGKQGLLNLNKGGLLNLTKKEPGLDEVNFAIGWKPAVNGPTADLDLAAFMLASDGTVHNIPQDVIFFNHKVANGIRLLKDNRTGKDGETSDDETIEVTRSQIENRIRRIVFVATIFEAEAKRQTFGMIKDAFIRAYNRKTGEELCRFELREVASTSTALVFAELYFDEDDDMMFRAIGESSIGDLNDLLSMYI